jgi:hypothetical protein
LHRFLKGDENSAQDAKTMLDSCAILMDEFDCTVILVHHTGVSEDAQHRARGSSAWRGALDIEVSVKAGNSSRPIEVVQRKMKDAEMSDSLFFDLKPVTIKGWRDEDNEPVKTVVLESVSAPVKTDKKESKIEGHRKRFERAWHASHRERDEKNRPHVNRYSMIQFLTGPSIGISESAAKKACQADSSRMIGALIDAGYIIPHGNGWSANDSALIVDFGNSVDN